MEDVAESTFNWLVTATFISLLCSEILPSFSDAAVCGDLLPRPSVTLARRAVILRACFWHNLDQDALVSTKRTRPSVEQLSTTYIR